MSALRPDSLARKVWQRAGGKIVPYGEFAAWYFTERVEAAVIDYVSDLRDAILVTTRPALNLISARRGSSSVIGVAQEHVNLASYREAVREQIIRTRPSDEADHGADTDARSVPAHSPPSR
ncbi:hypothetical protein ITP53_17560 [Nonomuraea sp. K274]|uniref:Uncharacterized protein n=1 Tax=Nonomuraea cypriaca TaxID=1187855 RepID=A0A931AAA2_9ACTN|nr:hypothetical protein [Nonomuraea cypriaca]MBF8187509.1 hypothetical protein [Nonomuraea cypriaca]